MNDNPEAVLDFDFPLITLEDNDGYVDNDEVYNVSPSSSVNSWESVSSGGRDLFIGDLDKRLGRSQCLPTDRRLKELIGINWSQCFISLHLLWRYFRKVIVSESKCFPYAFFSVRDVLVTM